MRLLLLPLPCIGGPISLSRVCSLASSLLEPDMLPTTATPCFTTSLMVPPLTLTLISLVDLLFPLNSHGNASIVQVYLNVVKLAFLSPWLIVLAKHTPWKLRWNLKCILERIRNLHSQVKLYNLTSSLLGRWHLTSKHPDQIRPSLIYRLPWNSLELPKVLYYPRRF